MKTVPVTQHKVYFTPENRSPSLYLIHIFKKRIGYKASKYLGLFESKRFIIGEEIVDFHHVESSASTKSLIILA